jgi:membrane associated rhomboid family serine protease
VIPFIDTAPRAARPVVVLALIALNTLVFLWLWTMPPDMREAILTQLALIPARYTEPELAHAAGLDPNDWWPFLTSAFLHGGWLHLITNMWFLWIFGPAMEARLGRLGFSFLYLAGAVAASFVHVLTNVDSVVPVLGASGAIAAVIGAYALTYPSAYVITIVPIFIFPLFIPVPALLFALIWFGLQVVQGISDVAAPGMAGGVAWWAHIGGFVFGTLFALAANAMRLGMQTRTAAWDMRGRRVPDIRPPQRSRWDF